ncbi:hypothetical protein SAM23877_2915 [Streptomyces ambofaciens ATCC 23877]|uniref:Uncharacterized protein n=1 Tax=Streptomyces ambofaciens (strain ATCC 23877 / 3486 / DSM 40053 / JCM 4204 / NBRC 12836 / NRRL B-2516) TaxID=278992 RepID=A0A0K2ASI2_STRA7|nr:hypothetical protein SAM23877_2915 [Streptomyces ambofaciens ATCC 23877]
MPMFPDVVAEHANFSLPSHARAAPTVSVRLHCVAVRKGRMTQRSLSMELLMGLHRVNRGWGVPSLPNLIRPGATARRRRRKKPA